MKKAGRPGPEKIMSDIPDYHTSPVQAGETAQAAKAKMLVFTHIIPAVPVDYLKSYYLKGVDDAYDGKIVLGEDGMMFSLPANKNSIEQEQLL
jgi:ribonuclease Z